MRKLLAFLNRPASRGNFAPRAANAAPFKILVCLLITGVVVVAAVNEYATNKYLNVGYTPAQPVAFDHSFHAGPDSVLGLDCRYCHNFVEKSPHSNVPTANTCWNCHSVVKPDSPALALVKKSVETGEAIRWVKVHKVPDYVYFPHSVHVNRGVSCVECHGRIDQQVVVGQQKSLNMSFCLDCHRNPEQALRPLDKITDLAYKAATPADQVAQGTKFVHDWKINPPQSCSGCHR
jgi:hypothetical protein